MPRMRSGEYSYASRSDGSYFQRRTRVGSCAGIALLELMLATAILGIALISLGIAVARCVRGFAASEQIRVVLQVGEEVLAQSQLAASVEGEVKAGVHEGERRTSRGPVSWTQQVETTEDPNVLRSMLILRWSERGHPRERSFVSLVSRKPRTATDQAATGSP